MTCKHYDRSLESEDRHYIPDKNFNNCVLCIATAKGPMTQEEVGVYFGVSKMRISQIERAALVKVRKKMALACLEKNPLLD